MKVIYVKGNKNIKTMNKTVSIPEILIMRALSSLTIKKLSQ